MSNGFIGATRTNYQIFSERQIARSSEMRYCQGCGKPMAQSNLHKRCYACQKSDRVTIATPFEFAACVRQAGEDARSGKDIAAQLAVLAGMYEDLYERKGK